MFAMSWMMFMILVLASYRLTRLIVFDKITSFIRRPFFDEQFQENENGVIVAVIEEKGGRVRAFMRELLSCYWCVGIWMSIVIAAAYLLFPTVSFPVMLVLALAGAAGIIESFVKG
ncbi:MAG: sporulation protein [Paenibacillus sp. RIFOXYA1_FULL_44_5]|nr:MAG: sporulation protein [Paenibacillus sp. RIFOXYA1_FULL_44_5]